MSTFPAGAADEEGDRVFTAAAELFGLLSTPVRLKIVVMLSEGELNVGQLLARVATTQPNLSQHLSTLYRCGILARRRRGAQVLYRIASDRVRLICETVQLAQAQASISPP